MATCISLSFITLSPQQQHHHQCSIISLSCSSLLSFALHQSAVPPQYPQTVQPGTCNMLLLHIHASIVSHEKMPKTRAPPASVSDEARGEISPLSPLLCSPRLSSPLLACNRQQFLFLPIQQVFSSGTLWPIDPLRATQLHAVRDRCGLQSGFPSGQAARAHAGRHAAQLFPAAGRNAQDGLREPRITSRRRKHMRDGKLRVGWPTLEMPATRRGCVGAIDASSFFFSAVSVRPYWVVLQPFTDAGRHSSRFKVVSTSMYL